MQKYFQKYSVLYWAISNFLDIAQFKSEIQLSILINILVFILVCYEINASINSTTAK